MFKPKLDFWKMKIETKQETELSSRIVDVGRRDNKSRSSVRSKYNILERRRCEGMKYPSC